MMLMDHDDKFAIPDILLFTSFNRLLLVFIPGLFRILISPESIPFTSLYRELPFIDAKPTKYVYDPEIPLLCRCEP
jgi:hypothetical protein